MSRINPLLSTILFMFLFYPSFAQNANDNQDYQMSESQKIELAIKNYKKALDSENPGMIESAILNVMNLKFHYPNYDYSSLIESLESLENGNDGKAIGFMSYIVKNYLLYPERYAWISKSYYEFDKDIFSVIAEKISAQVSE